MNLIKQHLLDNQHRVRVTLTPDSETAVLAAAEADRRYHRNGFNRHDKAILKQQALDLAARQAAPDDLSLIAKSGFRRCTNRH